MLPDERPDIIPQGLEADIPYLGAEEVVDEVLTLLARLDKDRIETEESLKKEKNRVKMLGSEIDQLAEKRRLNLPAAVQAGTDSIFLFILHQYYFILKFILLFYIFV